MCACVSRCIHVNDACPCSAAGPYFLDCISETVEENHFIVKVITMDVDWDGLTPADRAGSKVQYSITAQTRTVSGCTSVYTTYVHCNAFAYLLATTCSTISTFKVQLSDSCSAPHTVTQFHTVDPQACTLIMLHRTLGELLQLSFPSPPRVPL